MADLLDYCADLPVESTPPGGVLIAEGARPGRLLVLESGSVSVSRDGVPIARIDAPGAVLGEMSLVLDKPATATLVDVTVRVVDEPLTFRSGQALGLAAPPLSGRISRS